MKRLTDKEKNFSKEFVMGEEPGNATKAAWKSYNVKNRDSAKAMGWNALQQPRVQMEIERLMEDHKITDDFMMQRLREGLNAKVVANYKGEATKTNVPDHAVRHKYWQDAAKIKEYYPADKLETRNLNIDVQLETMTKGELGKLFKQALKQLDEK